MIDPALTDLIRMLMRAGLRQGWRLVKKPAGAVMVLFLIAMMSFAIVSGVAFAYSAGDQSNSGMATLLTGSIPVVMYALTVVSIATGSGDALLELKPPELQFVLAGPFTNSHVLSYRLMTLLIVWIPLSLFFSLFMLPHFGSFLGGVLGFLLAGPFVVLVAFQYTLVKPNLSPAVLQRIRQGALLSLLVIATETTFNLGRAEEIFSVGLVTQAINDGWMTQIVSVPYRPFASLIQGELGIGLLLNAAICTGLVSLIAFCCYQTNGGFSELAVEGVARRKQKVERIKGGNVYGFSPKKTQHTRSIPAFRWFGGAGPVAWSQVVSVSRRTGRLVPGILLIGVVAAMGAAITLHLYPNVLKPSQRSYMVPIALGAAAYLGFLLTMTAQTGLTASPRLLTWYQTLPIPPISIAIGMVAGTSVLLMAIQLALCLPALVVSTQTWVECLSIMFAGFAFSVTYASTTNLVSAATGLRPMPQGTPDVYQGARAMIYMLVLSVAMIPMLICAAVAAGIAGALLGFTWSVCSIAAGLGMLIVQPAVWWFSGERFVHTELKTG